MIILDNYRVKLMEISERLTELASAMRIKQVTEKLAEYEQLTSDPEFWNDMERSQKILVEQKRQKSILEAYQAVVNKHEDAQTLVELARISVLSIYDSIRLISARPFSLITW